MATVGAEDVEMDSATEGPEVGGVVRGVTEEPGGTEGAGGIGMATGHLFRRSKQKVITLHN